MYSLELNVIYVNFIILEYLIFFYKYNLIFLTINILCVCISLVYFNRPELEEKKEAYFAALTEKGAALWL